jgi:DNA-binding NarL/FixJ family response regulator
MNKTTVLIADDHPLFRKGLGSLIEEEPDYDLVGEVSNGVEAVDKAMAIKPDIVIMDIVMPDMDGMLAAEIIRKKQPEIKIIFLSMHQQKEYVLRVYRSGAEGYVLKDFVAEELMLALNRVRDGKRYVCPSVAEYFVEEYINLTREKDLDLIGSLTLKEKEVLGFIVGGKTNKEISERLNVSLDTIKSHRNSIMHKFSVHDVESLTKLAIENGYYPS